MPDVYWMAIKSVYIYYPGVALLIRSSVLASHPLKFISIYTIYIYSLTAQ